MPLYDDQDPNIAGTAEHILESGAISIPLALVTSRGGERGQNNFWARKNFSYENKRIC